MLLIISVLYLGPWEIKVGTRLSDKYSNIVRILIYKRFFVYYIVYIILYIIYKLSDPYVLQNYHIIKVPLHLKINIHKKLFMKNVNFFSLQQLINI